MAPLSEVRAQNSAFAAQKNANKVCVFVGATNGIGENTLQTVSSMLVKPTIYIMGRSAARWQTQSRKLGELGHDAKYIFIEADVSTIRGVDEACKQILAAESKIDYLFMSAGYFPLVGQIETSEGLEQCFALSYWARMRFLHNLFPALQQSPLPRVLSVFAGGHEAEPLREDDMDLAKSWSIPNFAHQVSIMMTLALHHFASKAPNMTLIHTWPGYVLTNRERKPKPDASASLLWRWTYAALQEIGWFFLWMRGITEEESGERHAYILTNDKFGPGVLRVNEHCEPSPRVENLEKHVAEGKQDKVWNFTVTTWEKALTTTKK